MWWAAVLLAAGAAAQTPVPRRAEVRTLFMFDLCTTSFNGSNADVECPEDQSRGLTSLSIATVANTGAGDFYVFELTDDFMQSRYPANRQLSDRVRIQIGVGPIVLKYKYSLEIRVPDRYVVQRDKGSLCAGVGACDGKFFRAPSGEPCTTTEAYAGGISFRNVTEDFFPGLAIIPTEDMYRGFDQSKWVCGASHCGVCLGGQSTRGVCDTERFHMVYPMWDVFRIDGYPFISYRVNGTFLFDAPEIPDQTVFLAVNLDTAPNGEPYRIFNHSDNRAISMEVVQQTTVFPFPAIPGYIVAAERHPRADETLALDPTMTNDRCPPGADAQGIYCPVRSGFDEPDDPVLAPDVNPRPRFCEPLSRWWFYAEQGINGWRHGYECNQLGIRPEWYAGNNGRNAEIPCSSQPGTCVPGFDVSLTSDLDARKFPPFYTEQNREQRGSVCTAGATPNGDCVGEWDCDTRAPVNTPWPVQSNSGFANSWLSGQFLYVEPSRDTNVFIEVNMLIAGSMVEVQTVRGSGHLRSPTFDPCILVQGRDGSFIVEACNDTPLPSDFAVTITCDDPRYGLGTGEAQVSLGGNECDIVGPINIRLTGDIVPGGMFCTAQLFELGTLSLVDTLDQRCEELPPRREEPLGVGTEGLIGEPMCSWYNLLCHMGYESIDWLGWLTMFGLFMLLWLIIALVVLLVAVPLIKQRALGGGGNR